MGLFLSCGGKLAFISSCDRDLWAPLSSMKGVKLLSSFERKLRIAFEALQEKKGLISC